MRTPAGRRLALLCWLAFYPVVILGELNAIQAGAVVSCTAAEWLALLGLPLLSLAALAVPSARKSGSLPGSEPPPRP